MLRMYGKFEGLGCLSCWCWKCFFGGWGPIRWPVCVILVFQIILYFSPGSRQEMMQFHLHISFQMGVGKPPTSPEIPDVYISTSPPKSRKKGSVKTLQRRQGWTPILVPSESLNSSPLKILPLEIYDPPMGRIVLRPSFSGVIAVELRGCKGLI